MDFSKIDQMAEGILNSIDKGDVVVSYSESSPVDFDMDHLKSIEDLDRFAIGLRLFKNGRVGNSFVNTPDDLVFLLKSAGESSNFGDEIDIDLPSKSVYPNLELYYPEVMKYPKEKCMELGEEMVRHLKSIDSNAKISAGISKNYHKSWLANTNGFKGSYEESHYSVSANMMLVDDDGGLLFVGDGESAYDLNIDLDTIYKNIEWRYKNAQNKVSLKTGYFPVIFSPEALDLILDPIEIAASGKTLYKGISVLNHKLGQKIGNDNFSIIDDPFYPKGMGSYPYDDEGVIPARLPVIENGVFKNFIYDLTTAKRMGEKSTGHGSRNVSSLPSPSFSNLIIPPGKTSLDDMIRSIDYGLIVYEFLGGGMSNVLAGDFSVNIELGFLIENGQVKGRVKDAMLSGNAFQLLTSIKELENKTHKRGSLYAPNILFDKVSVAG